MKAGVDIRVFRVVDYFTDSLSSARPKGPPWLGVIGQKFFEI